MIGLRGGHGALDQRRQTGSMTVWPGGAAGTAVSARGTPGASGVKALRNRALRSKAAGEGVEDVASVIAGHQAGAGAEVSLAVREAGRQLAGHSDRYLRVLLAVPQVDRGGHVLKAKAPRPAVPEQVSGHDRGSLPVALLQVLDQSRL